MERRRFGPTKHEASVIGQGTWYLDRGDRAAAIAALRRGLDLGMNHIDTAEMYGGRRGDGRRGDRGAAGRGVPRLEGRARATPRGAGRSPRASGRSPASGRSGWTATSCTGRATTRSRTPSRPSSELKRAGKILSWGVSNFDVPDLATALEIAGEGRMACNQVLYHLKQRAIEHAVLPWCEERGVAVVGYSPFGHGDFPGPRSKGGRVLQEIAAAHGATPARSPSGSWCGGPRASPSPRRGGPPTPRRTPGPGTSCSPTPRSRGSTPRFPGVRGRESSRCSSLAGCSPRNSSTSSRPSTAPESTCSPCTSTWTLRAGARSRATSRRWWGKRRRGRRSPFAATSSGRPAWSRRGSRARRRPGRAWPSSRAPPGSSGSRISCPCASRITWCSRQGGPRPPARARGQHEREVEARLVEELLREASSGGRAICGVVATLDALWLGQVQTLVVADGVHPGGSECPGCGRLQPGSFVRCPTCDTPVRAVHDLFHRAMGHAREQASAVEVLHDEAARRLQAAGDGLGAMLRSAEPAPAAAGPGRSGTPSGPPDTAAARYSEGDAGDWPVTLTRGEATMATATETRSDTRTDEEIHRDVLAELKWDARVQPNEIGVVVKDGIVTLTGGVDSYLKKWAAEEAAHRVRGVKAVANDIEVRLPSSAERTDTDIAAAVAAPSRRTPRSTSTSSTSPSPRGGSPSRATWSGTTRRRTRSGSSGASPGSAG